MKLQKLPMPILSKKMTAAGYTIAPHAGLATVQNYMAKSKHPFADKSSYRSVPKGATYSSGSAYDNAAMKVEAKEKVNVLSIDLDANFVINNPQREKVLISGNPKKQYTPHKGRILAAQLVFVCQERKSPLKLANRLIRKLRLAPCQMSQKAATRPVMLR